MSPPIPRRSFALLFVALLIGLGEPAAAAPMFQGLGFLSGVPSSLANGVSADGSTVVGQSFLPCSAPSCFNASEAFRWTASGGMIGLGFLPGDNSSNATAASADGSTIIGGSYTTSGTTISAPVVFRWTLGGGMTAVAPPEGINPSLSQANGVSADGSMVVGVGFINTTEAVRWTSGEGIVGLGFLSGTNLSEANGLSSDGSTVVGYSQALPPGASTGYTGSQAFRWTASGGMVGLGFVQGTTLSVAKGVSADGSTVVGFSGSQAFRWTASGGMVGLGFLPGGSTSFANAVSGNGSTVVGSTSQTPVGDPTATAFVWDSGHGTRDLNKVLAGLGVLPSGWTLEDATGISADGQTIVGFGESPSGLEAWIAVIPEPATGLLLLAGVLGLAIARRRRAWSA